MAEFGFVNPELVNDDEVVVARHGACAGGAHAQLSEPPAIVLAHLLPTQRRALAHKQAFTISTPNLTRSGAPACQGSATPLRV